MKKHLPLLVIIVCIIAAFIWRSYAIRTQEIKNFNSQNFLNGLEKVLNINSPIQEYPYSDWITSNGNLEPLNGKLFWIGSFSLNDKKLAKEIQDHLEIVTQTFLTKYQTTINQYFVENGFNKNIINSTVIKGRDVPIVMRTGYELGDIKCVVNLYPTTDAFGSVFCGKIDQNQQSLQKQFINVFKYEKRPDNLYSFRVDKIEGNFATGTATDDVLGYQWIAKKENGVWKVIFKSNELGQCQEMERLGIPKSIYGDCYTP
ncbi:MAG TPA: hypothetical protein VG917_00665 [Patescibacteria group bacterium]|nr:hypothetical protein [Patescibacteria group bacterium]